MFTWKCHGGMTGHKRVKIGFQSGFSCWNFVLMPQWPNICFVCVRQCVTTCRGSYKTSFFFWRGSIGNLTLCFYKSGWFMLPFPHVCKTQPCVRVDLSLVMVNAWIVEASLQLLVPLFTVVTFYKLFFDTSVKSSFSSPIPVRVIQSNFA